MTKEKSINWGERPARRAASFALFLLVLCSCSSTHLSMHSDKKGRISEIEYMIKGRSAIKSVIGYDEKDRIISFFRFVASREKPVEERRFTYNAAGMLTLQYYESKKNDRTSARDIWYESLYYDGSKNLIRVETAYKTAYSIAKNRTPFKRMIFSYSDKRLEKIRIYAVTFTKEIELNYSANTISSIAYRLSLLNKSTNRYYLEKNLQIQYKNSRPVMIIDAINKIEIVSGDQIGIILDNEDINAPFEKQKLSRDTAGIREYLITEAGKPLPPDEDL